MTTPNDIATVITNAQDAIDAAVRTVTATRTTQNTLEQNIYTTDTKISNHNLNNTSHPDIRNQLTSLFNNPVVSGVNSVESGTEATWILSVVPKFSGVSCESFVVTFADGTSETITASNNQATFTHTFVGERNSTTFFTVTAQGGGFISNSVQHELLITLHMAPDMTNMTTTLPARISANHSYEFAFTGITDLDGDLDTISATTNNANVTLSTSSNLQEGTIYTLTVGNVDGPATVGVTFTATDTRSLSASRTFNVHLNGKPDATNFAHNLVGHLNSGSTETFRVWGVTDADADENLDANTPGITYSISSSNPDITFSKSSGIEQLEDVTVTVANTADPGDAYILTFTFTDSDGGTTTATISSTINITPSVANLTSSLTGVYIAPGASASMTLSGATDSEGEEVTYSIPSTDTGLTFSKTVGIAANESITATVASSVAHGSSLSYTVRATDASGAYAETTLTISVNDVVTELSTTLPLVTKPDTDYTFTISTATDSDGQALTFTVTSASTGVTITNGTSVSPGDVITLHSPTEAQLVRGYTYNVTITVNDTIENTELTYTIRQATLPTIDSSTTTVSLDGQTIQGGSENAETFTITGPVADANGLAQTFNIVNNDSDLTFSKTTGIASGESITVTASKVSALTAKTFNVTTTNSEGETSVVYITVSFDVDIIEVTAQPTITYPTANATAEYYNGFTMTWSAAAVAIDTDNTAAYPTDGSES